VSTTPSIFPAVLVKLLTTYEGAAVLGEISMVERNEKGILKGNPLEMRMPETSAKHTSCAASLSGKTRPWK
jgi:hypothetical protein